MKISLEKGKIKENDWNDKNNLSKLINDCIRIENTIENINVIYDKIKSFNSNKDLKFEFAPKNIDNEKGGLLNKIKNFGGLKVIENQIKNNKKNKIFLGDNKDDNDILVKKDNIIMNEINNINFDRKNTE